MIQITPQTLTTAPINWDLLPEVFRRQKENLALYQEFYNELPKVKENADKLIKEIIRTHNRPTEKKTPLKKQTKGKTSISKRKAPTLPKKKTPTPRKAIKVKAKPIVKAKKPKKAIKPKVNTKIKVVKEKALVNVKKYSLELQLIKSFIAMKGKDRKVTGIRNFLKKIESAKSNTNVSSQKTILTVIAQRMKSALAGLADNVDFIRGINIADDLLKQCKEAVKNAKPRLQVQYLSGVSGKK